MGRVSGFRLQGVIPAVVTPFDKHEEFDEPAFRNLINWLIDKGVSGIVPCGTTGEFSLMSPQERARVIEVCVDEVNSRIPVIAGTGDTSTKLVIESTRHAKDVGADAAIIVNPYYMKPKGGKGIYDHYVNIAEAVDFPIVLYNIPSTTNQYIPWEVVEDLAEIDNIVGLKDSSGDLKYMMSVLEKVGDKIDIVVGWDEVVLPALAAGANGMILASANVIAPIWIKIYDYVKEGRLEEARRLQRRIQKFTRHIVASGALGPKACLNYMGIPVGTTRRPILMGDTLSFEIREELRIELENLGLIEKRPITLKIEPDKPLVERFSAIDVTPEVIEQFKLRTGEALVDPNSNEVAHIDVLIGEIDGPVGQAYAYALANPTKDREAVQAILEPGMAVKPPTIIVPTVPVRSLRDASMVYGPAQEAVAKAVAKSVEDGILPATDKLAIIAKVFVHPTATRRHRVYINNFKAMRHAIRKAMEGRPAAEEAVENADSARHPLRESL
ncbi:MAG: 4-hydroxy-tetrahydrodipicolinate synthase [Candidatus Bathyarchaeia archaeon]